MCVRRSELLCIRAIGVLAGAVALLSSASAAASAVIHCRPQAFTQPFAAFGDHNWYTLAPGERYDHFSGRGWTLSGGARIRSATLYDGTRGSVLDLPSGAKAVSPAVCVTNDYPTARTMVSNVSGSAGVAVSVAYMGAFRWGPDQGTGTIKTAGAAWEASRVVNIHPSHQPGWQLARFTLTAVGTASEYHVYNYYVDPRMH